MLLWPFNKYPGTDYETFNWEWLISIGKKMEKALYDLFSDTGALHQMVDKILGEHPEWVTTVMDGAITAEKINNDFLMTIENAYVTPEEFGAIGDGEHDDTTAIQQAVNDGKIVVFHPKTYRINGPILIEKPVELIGSGVENTVILNKSLNDTFFIKLETEQKRHVKIADLTIDGDGNADKAIHIFSGEGYYLADLILDDIKTIRNEYGFYLDGVTGDNLFLSAIEHCTFWDGFYANNIGDTVSIRNCQFAYNNGIYINQVSGASSLVFENNNVTCENGFRLGRATSPRIAGNIFEYTHPCQNNHAFVEISADTNVRDLGYIIESNVFSYAADMNDPTIPLVYIGWVLKGIFKGNSIAVRDGNVSMVISNNCHMLQFDSMFGVYYGSETYQNYAMNDFGVNTLKNGVFWTSFMNGIEVPTYLFNLSNLMAIHAASCVMNTPVIITSSNNNGSIQYGEYVDELHTQNNKTVAYVTANGFLPTDLLIGGISNHCRILMMGGSTPENMQRGDLYINKYQTAEYDGYLYFYNGSQLVKLV